MLTATLIATDEALTLAREEVEAVAAQPCLQTSVALGDLTNQRIHTTFSRKCDVFWYAGHMAGEGIPLTDGTFLAPVALGAYIAAFECRLAFLNSCQGSESALAIHSQARRCMVLYYPQEIESTTAYHLGTLVAAQLCLGGVEAAVNFARSAGYRVLQAGMSYQYPGGGNSPELLQLLYELRERLVRVEEKMVRLEDDVRQLRQLREQPGNLSTRQLVGVGFGVLLSLVVLATMIAILSGRWGR